MYRRCVLLVALVAVGICLVAVPSPVQAQASTTTAIVRAFFLNVRSGPGANTGRVGLLQGGAVLTPLGRNSVGSWLKVQTSQGLVGWVSSRWVILSGTTLMSLPVVS